MGKLLTKEKIAEHLSAGALRYLGWIIASLVGGWLFALFVWFGDHPMNRLDWVAITLGSAVALMALFTMVVVAYPRAAEIWKTWFPGKRARPAPIPAMGARRTLSEQQKDALVEELRERGFGGSLKDYPLTIRYASGCSECKDYATEIADALALAGWHGDISTTLDETPELTGLRLYLMDMRTKPRSAAALASSLRAAGSHLIGGKALELEGR